MNNTPRQTPRWYPSRLKDPGYDIYSAYNGQVTGERQDGLLRPRFNRDAVELMATNTPRSGEKMIRLNGTTAEIWSRPDAGMPAGLVDHVDPVGGWYHIPGAWQESMTAPFTQFFDWYRNLRAVDYPSTGDWTVVFEDRFAFVSILATFPTPVSGISELDVLLVELDLDSYIVSAATQTAAEQAVRDHFHAERAHLDGVELIRPATTIAVTAPFPSTVLPDPS